MNTTKKETQLLDEVLTKEELLIHWQGHRQLTRQVIEAFPEKEFFAYRIGGMRTFAQMTMELLAIAAPGIEELVTGKQAELEENLEHIKTKASILEMWDETTEVINTYWTQLPASRFHDEVKLFGKFEGTVISSLIYFIDNEVHHRGQAYVYLRALGIEPPEFWDRPF